MNKETVKVQSLNIYSINILSENPNGPIVAEIITEEAVIIISSTTKINITVKGKNEISIFNNNTQHVFFNLLKQKVKPINGYTSPTAVVTTSGELKHGVNCRHEVTPNTPVIIDFSYDALYEKILKIKKRKL